MELKYGLFLSVVSLVSAAPYGFDSNGSGSAAKAEANAVAGAYSGLANAPIVYPSGGSYSGSFAKASSSSFASSSSSAISKAFSFSDSSSLSGPVINGVGGQNGEAVNHCNSGNCPSGVSNGPDSKGSGNRQWNGANAAAGALSLSGATGYGENGLCGGIECTKPKSSDCKDSNCGKVPSDKCLNSPCTPLKDESEGNDIPVEHTHRGVSNPQSTNIHSATEPRCSNGNCDAYAPVSSPSVQLSGSEKSTMTGLICNSPECQSKKPKIYSDNRPTSYNVPIYLPPAQPDQKPCISGKCQQPHNIPYQPQNVNDKNSQNQSPTPRKPSPTFETPYAPGESQASYQDSAPNYFSNVPSSSGPTCVTSDCGQNSLQHLTPVPIKPTSYQPSYPTPPSSLSSPATISTKPAGYQQSYNPILPSSLPTLTSVPTKPGYQQSYNPNLPSSLSPLTPVPYKPDFQQNYNPNLPSSLPAVTTVPTKPGFQQSYNPNFPSSLLPLTPVPSTQSAYHQTYNPISVSEPTFCGSATGCSNQQIPNKIPPSYNLPSSEGSSTKTPEVPSNCGSLGCGGKSTPSNIIPTSYPKKPQSSDCGPSGCGGQSNGPFTPGNSNFVNLPTPINHVPSECSAGNCPVANPGKLGNSPKIPPYTGGFGGPTGFLKPYDNTIPSNIGYETQSPHAKPVEYPNQIHNQPNSPPNFGAPTGFLKPNQNTPIKPGHNLPQSLYPNFAHPSTPSNNVPSGCGAGNCPAAKPVNPSSSPELPYTGGFGGPAGAPSNLPNAHEKHQPNSPPNFGAPTGFLKPNQNTPIKPGHNLPQSLYPNFAHPSTPSNNVPSACGAGNCPAAKPVNPSSSPELPYTGGFGGPTGAPSNLPNAHEKHQPNSPPNFGAPTGFLKPNQNTPTKPSYNSPQSLYPHFAHPSTPSNNVPSGCGAGNCPAAKPVNPNSSPELPYTGGFGGPTGAQSVSSNLPNAHENHQPASCISGNCGITTQPESACFSGKCGAPLPPMKNDEGATASANAIAYTGGFGGPPGVLKPFDGGKVVPTGSGPKPITNGGPSKGSYGNKEVRCSGGGCEPSKQNNGYDTNNNNGSGCGSQGCVPNGNKTPYGINSEGCVSGSCDATKTKAPQQDGSGCNGDCDSNSGAVTKSISGAVSGAGAYAGSFASSSAVAQATSGASSKGGYGRR